jgi:ferredoxin-NADP reductase
MTSRDSGRPTAAQPRRSMARAERLDNGEVSPCLVDELRTGDQFELRGPIGGYFVWEESLGGPLVLVGGGSGIVPLRAMLRHWGAGVRDTAVSLLYSARSVSDVIYREELSRLDGGNLSVHLALTRQWPPDWSGHRGRIDQQLLAERIPHPAKRPLVYVCGPTSFVESVAQALVEIGNEPDRIKTERFGATGA